MKRRRKWFVDFARENLFDPFDAQAWYNLQLSRIIPMVLKREGEGEYRGRGEGKGEVERQGEGEQD